MGTARFVTLSFVAVIPSQSEDWRGNPLQVSGIFQEIATSRVLVCDCHWQSFIQNRCAMLLAMTAEPVIPSFILYNNIHLKGI